MNAKRQSAALAVQATLPGIQTLPQEPARTKRAIGTFRLGTELTTEDLTFFLGGQLESANQGNCELYVGDICKAGVENSQLTIALSLVMNGNELHNVPRLWFEDRTKKVILIDLRGYVFTYLEARERGGLRILIQSDDRKQTYVFYPANGRRFSDLMKIKGRPVRE